MNPSRWLCPLVVVLVTDAGVAPAWEDHLLVVTSWDGAGSCAVVELDDPWVATVDVEPVSPNAVVRLFSGLYYVVNEPTATVQVIDPATTDTIAEYSVGVGSSPRDILLVDRQTAWVSRDSSCHLLKIDPADGTTLGSVDLCPLADADGLPEMGMMARDADHLFVQVRRLDPSFHPVPPSYLAVVDLTSDTLVDVDPQQAGMQGIVLSELLPSFKMHIDDVGRRLYVTTPGSPAEWGTGGIDQVDLDTLQSVGFLTTEAQIPLHMGPFVMVSEIKGYVVTHTDIVLSSHLVPFSRITGEALGGETYMTLGAVESMAFDPQTSQLYYPELSDGGVVVVDADADVVLTPLPIDVGGTPRDLVVARFGAIFSDGFESGDTSAWNAAAP